MYVVWREDSEFTLQYNDCLIVALILSRAKQISNKYKTF